MSFVRFCGCVVLGTVALFLAATAPASGQVKIPADFAYEQGKGSPAPATFSLCFSWLKGTSAGLSSPCS